MCTAVVQFCVLCCVLLCALLCALLSCVHCCLLCTSKCTAAFAIFNSFICSHRSSSRHCTWFWSGSRSVFSYNNNIYFGIGNFLRFSLSAQCSVSQKLLFICYNCTNPTQGNAHNSHNKQINNTRSITNRKHPIHKNIFMFWNLNVGAHQNSSDEFCCQVA